MTERPTPEKRALDARGLEDPSPDTRRASRNLGLLALAIILVQIFDVPIDRPSLGRVPLWRDQGFLVTVTAGVLLAYWSVLFAIRSMADSERRKERVRALTESVDALRARKAQLTGLAGPPRGSEHTLELAELTTFLSRHDAERERLAHAARLSTAARRLEWLATASAALIAAAIVLGRL